MLIDRLLQETAQRDPDAIAAIHGKRRASYGEILAASEGLASAIAEYGLKKGDRVVIALENSPEYINAYFGVMLAGCVTVSINPFTGRAAFAKLVADCSPAGLIASEAFLRNMVLDGTEVKGLRFILVNSERKMELCAGPRTSTLKEACRQNGTRAASEASRNGGDLASIIYTSGTTGEPKGVMLSHRNLVSNTRSIVSYLALTRSDRVMAVLPFFYSYGNSLLLTHVMQGGSLVIENSFMYPDVVLDSIAREGATGFAGVPSTFALLFHKSSFRSRSLPSLRYVTQAGGPMAHSTALEISKVLPEARLFIMYGQTEATARLSYLPPDDLHRKYGSIGKAIPGVTLEVIGEGGQTVKPGETGEIVASGENVMMGYWGNTEETGKVLKDGKLYTGDMATIDEDGYIYIVSRKKDIIKSGAHRIAPREIEEVILSHPSVHEAAVVGMPDPILGESIRAFAVLKDEGSCGEREILALCRKNLPLYKMPKSVQFMASLPKTETGKIRKEELKSYLNSTEGNP